MKSSKALFNLRLNYYERIGLALKIAALRAWDQLVKRVRDATLTASAPPPTSCD